MAKRINLSTDFPTRWQEFTDAVTDGNQDVIESFITSVYESFYKEALGNLRLLYNKFSVVELEDIVSESIEAVFLNLTKSTKNYSFDSERKLFSYIVTICKNKAVDYLKHYSFIGRLDSMSEIQNDSEIEKEYLSKELENDPKLKFQLDMVESIQQDSPATYIFRKNFGNHPKIEKYFRDNSKCVELLYQVYIDENSYSELLKTETYKGLQEANLRQIKSRCIKKLKSLLQSS